MSNENSEITDDSKHELAHVEENAESVSAGLKTDEVRVDTGDGVVCEGVVKVAQKAVVEALAEEKREKGVDEVEVINVEQQGSDNASSEEEEKGAECDTIEEQKESELEEPMAKLVLENETIGGMESEGTAAAAEPVPNTEAVEKKNLLEQQQSKVIVTNKSSASLNNLLVYETSSSEEESEDDDDDDEEEEEEDDTDEVSVTSKNNVLIMDSSSSSSCGSTDMLNELESSSSSSSDEEEVLSVPKPSKIERERQPKNKFGDYIGKDPLPMPDLSNLTINVKPNELAQIGKISAMVDEFVMVEANPGIPPYNLDTFMFLEDCTFLGAVFDVMGPVSAPIYVIRFKSAADVAKLKLRIGVNVCVSAKGEHTKYVFVGQLLSAKGSDASWVGDVEVPEEFEEFSDDEKESKKKAGLKGTTRKRNSLERHQNFEHKMNKKNTMDTVCQIAKSRGGPSATTHHPNYQYLPPPLAVPAFDPSRPPPPPPPSVLQTFPPFPPAAAFQVPPNFPGFQGNWGYGHQQPPGL